MSVTPPFIVFFGPFRLDLKAGELLRNGGKVRLHEQPFQVLQMLIEHPGEVVTREEIRKKLWPNDTVVEFDHSINAAIQKLRQALGDSAENPKYVETVARRGYRLLVPVGQMEARSADLQGALVQTGAQTRELAQGNLIGKKVSHYRVLEVLGGGGMGVVYRAEDLKLGRRVALKFLPEELARDAVAMERFGREARAAAALNHPNICTIYEVEEHAGQPFIVMELLEGHTLRELLSAASPDKPPLEIEKLLDLAMQITEGLEAAHRQGIIHRDIKPANIFVTTQRKAKILDFGLAKLQESETADLCPRPFGEKQPKQEWNASLTLTRTGLAIGTAGYMSPEQIRGEKLDARTDLFSFGLVLYEMATGQRAFTGDTGPELHDAILMQVPTPARNLNPSIPPKLEPVINKALQKDREARYQSAAELQTDLESLKQGLLSKPHTLRWLGAAAGLLAVLLVSTVVWIEKRPPSAAPELKLRQLTFNSGENPVGSGAISPDGKYLAYTDAKGMHIQFVDTGEVHAVPPPDALQGSKVNWEILPNAWFPDSTRFLANAHPAGESQSASAQASSIWMVSAQGGVLRKLRDNAGTWSVSPDGSLISFATNMGRFGPREIWLMGPNGEQARKLFDAGEVNCLTALTWAPYGQRVIYIRSEAPCASDGSDDTLVSSDLKGGPTVTIFPPSEMKNVTDFSWLPDGRLIYSVKEPNVVGDNCNYWAVRLDARTGQTIEKPRRLTNWAGFCLNNAGATANGKRLMFLESAGHGTVYVADLVAGGSRILNSRRFTSDEDTYLRGWTPDSKTILFGSNRGGTLGIYKQSLNNDEPERLGGASGFREARVNADGKWVFAFLYPKPEGPAGPEQLMRIPLTGGSPELIFSASPESEISCSNPSTNLCVIAEATEDRKRAVVTAFDPVKGRGSQLARFDLDPSQPPNQSGLGVWSYEISPEGTRLAVRQGAEGPIHILSLRGQQEQVIQAEGLNMRGDFYWAADGKGLYVGSGVKGGTALVHVDLQGNAHVLWENYGIEVAAYGIPSPDGRHLAILGWTVNSNMWMMENF